MRTTIKKKLFAFYFVFLLGMSYQAYSQSPPEAVIRTAVLIDTPNGHASGFYYQDSLYTYLVTARHVLVEKLFTFRAAKKDSIVFKYDSIVCKSYPKDPIKGDQNILSINIKIANKAGQISVHHSHDLMIIKLGGNKLLANNIMLTNYYSFISKNKSSRIDPFRKADIQKYDSVHVSDDIYIFGYPTSLGIKETLQYDFQRPLLRKGVVAGKYDKEKTYIIDCPSYPGNSGGPVIVKSYTSEGINFYLIGILIEFIPYEEQWKNTRNNLINTQLYNSGYSVVEPIDFLYELISQ